MKQAILPTIYWLITTTLSYISYWWLGFNHQLDAFFQSSKLIKVPLFYNNSLVKLYLISLLIVLAIGAVDSYLSSQQQQAIQQQQQQEHRRYYSASN
ncbi:hypothetical protein [Halanaerobaculum tunisiense]